VFAISQLSCNFDDLTIVVRMYSREEKDWRTLGRQSGKLSLTIKSCSQAQIAGKGLSD